MTNVLVDVEKAKQMLAVRDKHEAQKDQLTDEELDSQLPKPVGYMVLVALPKIEKQYSSGIYKAEKTVHEEYIMSSVGTVVDIGTEAYCDKDRFPNGAWCKVGDFVMFRPNTGTRFKVNGAEYRLMNDDSIQAVVADPRGIVRA